MQDDIQSRLRALRARLELIRQRVRKCGNTIVESREQCDDGNRVNGDGCSRMCTVEVIVDPEPPVEINTTQSTTCPPESETRPYSTCLPSKLITLDLKVFLQGAYNATQ